jgi:Rho GDP-dissociation inhibitor
LDAEDESLQKWKASLGLGTAAAGSGGAAGNQGPKVEMLSLSLVSDSRPQGPLVLDLTQDLTLLKDATKKNREFSSPVESK